MMNDVRPSVLRLWRLLRILEKEERECKRKEGKTTGGKETADLQIIQAYISPRSPPIVKSTKSNPVGDYEGNIGQQWDSFESSNNLDSDYKLTWDSQNGYSTARVTDNKAETYVLSSQPIREDLSPHDRYSPEGYVPSEDRDRERERGRGRSRERHIVRKDSDSPVMPASRDIMGTSTTNNEGSSKGDTSGAPTGKATARIIARRRPSPKRSAAPIPPNPRACPSPAPKPVSTSDVSPADIEGWLLDQLRGRQVWCVLSDMLFCVFEKPEAKTSKQVLVLPGCTVRVLEFKSAHLHLNNRRVLHQARLNSTSSLPSSSVSSDSNSVLVKDDNNNKQIKDISVCEVTQSKDSTLDNGEIVSKFSTSSSISNHSVDEKETRIDSIGSDGSSVSSDNSSSVTNNDHQSAIGASNNKTVSGVDRFQFVLENTITRQKHMFAVASRTELDLWTNALNKACSLDISNKDSSLTSKDVNRGGKEKVSNLAKGRSTATKDLILTDDTDNSVSNGKSRTGLASPRSKTKPGEESMSPTYTPRQTLPSRIDVHSLSLSLTQPHDVSKETVDEIRRKLKKENHYVEGIESKPFPLKATHQIDESIVQSPRLDTSSTATGNGESSRKGRHFFKGRSPLDVLLGRKKRSASADDAYNRNRKLFPVYRQSEDNLSNPSFSPRQAGSTGSQQSLASTNSSHSQPGQRTHDSSFSTSSSVDSRDSRSKQHAVSSKSRKQRESPLARSWDPEMKTSRGFGASIRRTASDLKERVFGGSSGSLSTTKTSQKVSDKSKAPGLKLKDLTEAKVKGHLQYRIAYKFTKVFCVLSKGCFYAFKSEKPDEIPLLAMVLSPCSVTYVVESELQLHRKKSKQKQNQRLFAFKLSQPHCKSIYACAENQQTLMQWVMAIQAEACRVQVDEELAAEIREKPSSLKKKSDKELSRHISIESQDQEGSSHSTKKNISQMNPRLSCPAFDEASLQLALVARGNNSRESTLNGLITPRRGPASTSVDFQKVKEREEKRWKEKARSILNRSKSDREVESSAHPSRSSKLKSRDIAGHYIKPDNGATQHHNAVIESPRKTSVTRNLKFDPSLANQLDESSTDFINASNCGSVGDANLSTEQQLKLDLSSLADSKDYEDQTFSARNTTKEAPTKFQSHSHTEVESAQILRQSQQTPDLFSPSSKSPWKPNVKRSSSLNSTSLKSPSRSSILKSTLLPSRSKTVDSFAVPSRSVDRFAVSASSNSNPSKDHNQLSTQTEFFSPGEPSNNQDISLFSGFPGYRTKTASNRDAGGPGVEGHNDIDTEIYSPEEDIISPPPLFRSPVTLTSTENYAQDVSNPTQPLKDNTTSPSTYTSREEDKDRPSYLPFPATTDPAVREAWSHDEDYLLEVIRDKLRQRSRRQRDPDPEEVYTGNHVIFQNGNDPEFSLATTLPRPSNQMATLSDVMHRKKATDVGDEMDNDDIGEHSIELESSLEKQDDNGKWHRVLCSLKEPCLFFSTPENEFQSVSEVAELTGYDVTELIDQIPGKRFVLRLDHLTAPSILLSLDSRDDLATWKHGILTSLKKLRHAHKQVPPISRYDEQHRRECATTPEDEPRPQAGSSSAQSIKQKLLAEMLRQREELERMQAIRAEMKAGGQHAHNDHLVLDEDRIIALTRLRQRRMSTQIKLQTIQRQMESASGPSPRDRKSTFLPLGRKKAPDLLLQTQHAKEETEKDQEDSRTALEAQVKRLSSRLHDLDENISNHAASTTISPRDEINALLLLRKHSPKSSSHDILRHSLDPSTLPSGLEASLRESLSLEYDHEEDLTTAGRVERSDSGDTSLGAGTPRSMGVDAKRENRGKDGSASSSKSGAGGFKSSVQKLAHRTFSKATNWNWATKKAVLGSPTSPTISSPRFVKDGLHNNNHNNNNNNKTIPSVKEDSEYGEISTPFLSDHLSENTPDVIDMTTQFSNSMTGEYSDHRPRKSLDDSDIHTVPMPLYPDKGMHSIEGKSRRGTSYPDSANFRYRTPKERILSKMANTSSLSGTNRFDHRLQNFSSSNPDLALDDSHPHSHLGGNSKAVEFGKSGLEGRGSSHPTWRPTSLVLPSSTMNTSRASPGVTRASSATSSTPSPRGSEGKVVTPRREVNPDALAQIEAFEELSLKYLGTATK